MKSGRSLAIRHMSLALAGATVCSSSSWAAPRTPAPEAGEKTLAYTTNIEPTKDVSVDTGIAASSMLQSLQKTQAVGAYALAGRIRGDYDRIDGALQSQGYYAGSVKISVIVGGRTLDGRDPTLPEALNNLPAGAKVKIDIAASCGTQFHIGSITLTTPPEGADGKAEQSASSKRNLPPSKAKASAPADASRASTSAEAAAQGMPVTLNKAEQKVFGLSSGQPAVASDVLAAQGHLQDLLQEEGHAVADVSAPLAYLRPETKTLDLVFRVAKGPVVVIGPINMSGLAKVKQAFLRRRLTVKEGQLYQPSTIEAARQDLASVGVFSSVQVRNAPPIITLTPGKSLVPGVFQAMPIDFGFKESKRRTVAAQLGYSTDLGGRAGATWTHHNLFGNAERLKLTALVTGLGGSAQQGLGYDVYADLMKPDFMGRGRNLSVRVEGVRQDLYSYTQTALLARVGITQHVARFWTVSGSLSAEQEHIRQFGVGRNYFIVSAPLNGTYDSTELSNPIDPATHGIRASVSVTPSVSLESQTSFFTLLSAQISTYFDLARLGLTKPGRSVFAVRGIVGSVQGASTYQIPPDQRLYAGGPATIRGFRYQGVGPQYGNTKYAIGGTSLDAGSVEFRQRILKSFGMAAFADAGQVGDNSTPGHGALRVGYGGGVRYYTPIGPIRVDVALPVNRPPHGDKWELYIGLGETF
ncbi:autotransporter assembly complex protein TamA [Gluconobacter wancherniae]|uniref:autotransporter assembly complex protein TamA n=1 Tax=Gluconobacter wancherniae TaxID=1307955 RepID=UPI0038CF86AB